MGTWLKSLSLRSFADASNGWAVGEKGTVLRTTSGGGTWTKESAGVSGDVNRVAALSTTAAAAAGAGGALLVRH